MDERSLILHAIKQKHEILRFDEFINNSKKPDAIDKWVTRKLKQEKHKYKHWCDWNNIDFLNYLDAMLKDFGVSRVKKNIRQDANQINRLYDKLSDKIKVLDNKVFKEYFDWWCSIWASRFSSKELYLENLCQDYQIKLFAKRYSQEKPPASLVVKEQHPIEITEDTIYDLGGLELLMLEKGIVAGVRFLKSKGTNNVFLIIHNTLSGYTKESLVKTLNITIQNAPYPKADTVDFILLAQSLLNKYGIVDYSDVLYTNFFKGE